MVDVDELSRGLEFSDPIPAFDELRERVESLVEEDEYGKICLRLEERLDDGDSSRSAGENAWLYQRLGDSYRELGRQQDAIEAYAKAFEYEPRDKKIAEELADLLTAQEQFDEGLEAARLVLLAHKQELDDEEIAHMYRRLGSLQEGRGQYEEARVAFEKALVKAPDDPASLTGLLRAVGEVGDPGDVIEARLRLIRSLDQAEARSTALVALGNDWVDQFNDFGRALDTFEEAVTEWPENVQAVERIADVAKELEDWRRVCRAYFTLSVLAEEPEKKAGYLIESSDVARNELWEPEKALAGYRKALEWDASRLDAFTAVTSILVDARDWEHLEEAYLQVIASNQDDSSADPQLLGVLWQKLAELYSEHLDRYDDAIFAYSQAIEHLPEYPEIRQQFVDLAEDKEEHLDEAARHLRVLMQQQPDNADWTDRLGRVFLRNKEIDKAYCVFRALRARGEKLDQKALGFLERFDSQIVRSVQGKINPSVMKRYVFADRMSSTLNECFSVLKEGLYEWAGESRRKYGLKRRDRVKLSEHLAFVNFYKSVGAALGYIDLPELWRKEDQVGLMNGALVPEGFIVGDELLASAREKKIAFVVAKQLFLFLDPFYLATIRPLTDLQGFFMRAVALIQEPPGLVEQFKKDTAYKAMKKKIRGGDRQRLQKCIDQLTAGSDEVHLGPWVESIEDSANRIGLLFCDDLEAARECIRNEPRGISQRSVKERMRALIDYSVSEKYFAIRSELGLKVA